MVSGRNSILCSFYESFIKFGYQELFIHLSLSLFLESKRTWSFLMNLEKKSTKRKNQNLQWNFHWDGTWETCEDSTFPLALFLESRRTWRFLMNLEIGRSILWKLSSNFHQIWTSGTQSWLHLSYKSLTGVLEDMEVPDDPGDGVR